MKDVHTQPGVATVAHNLALLIQASQSCESLRHKVGENPGRTHHALFRRLQTFGTFIKLLDDVGNAEKCFQLLKMLQTLENVPKARSKPHNIENLHQWSCGGRAFGGQPTPTNAPMFQA